MVATALCIFALLFWWFGVGPSLVFFNAVAHSETNCLIGWMKAEGKSTFKLRVYQVLHCIGYIVWVAGLIAIPVYFKIYFN